MHFEEGYIYHIYNQGNNKQRIFFNRENYLFFLKKIKTYISPYADIIAWTLMPNHFHLMVKVKYLTIGVAQSNADGRMRSVNDSIGIMLRSYTNAINKQQDRTGKLFREKTKAECINCPRGITPTFYNTEVGTQIHINDPQKQYPQVCFDYIHNNPIKVGLVKKLSDWEYSSYNDYYSSRNGKLINKQLAAKFVKL